MPLKAIAEAFGLRHVGVVSSAITWLVKEGCAETKNRPLDVGREVELRIETLHLNKITRKQWLDETWPKFLAQAKRQGAWLLFGDEASFPQWGTLTDTWAKMGEQPAIETSGKRKGYKVRGLIDYFTGRFFFKC